MAMNPVVHFEMPAEDRKRMIDFYTQAFGWKAEQLGQDHENYVVVKTSECDEKGFPKERARINGGFYQKKDDPKLTKQHPSIVISVEDIKAHMKIVAEVGGKVLGEPWDIPGVGLYISFLDTEGNRVSMIQPHQR